MAKAAKPGVYSALKMTGAGGQHLTYDDCLEDKKEYYQNCPVLYCVPYPCIMGDFIFSDRITGPGRTVCVVVCPNNNFRSR